MTHYRTIADLLDLHGKVAVVTGAGKGIGRSSALRLAEAGAAVVISDIDESAAHEAATLITQSNGTVAVIHADISLVADAERIARFAIENFGRLDILVNNAGIFPAAPLLELSEALWDKVIDVNLKGAVFAAQAAARRMIAGGHGGRIINVASIDALFPTGNLTAYDASKGGLVMITRSLAKELGQYGILVNAVAPGGVNTPGARQGAAAIMGVPADTVDLSQFPVRGVLGRSADPDEMARVVLFLASDLSTYMTGSLVVADGGYLIV